MPIVQQYVPWNKWRAVVCVVVIVLSVLLDSRDEFTQIIQARYET